MESIDTEDGATGDGEAGRTRGPPGAKHATGVVVGLGVLALVAGPALVTALFALASFTYSEPPEPSVGALWAGITLVLLTLPVAAGMLTARRQSPPGSMRSPRRWLPTALAAVVLIAAWRLLQRVV